MRYRTSFKALPAPIWSVAGGFMLAVLSACTSDGWGGMPIEFVHTSMADSIQVGTVRYASAEDAAQGGQPVCRTTVDLVTLRLSESADTAFQPIVDSINAYILGSLLQVDPGVGAEEGVRQYAAGHTQEFNTFVRDEFASSYEYIFGDSTAVLNADDARGIVWMSSFDYKATSQAWIGRRDSVVCYRFRDERYSGGAHAMHWTTCRTFSLTDGRPLVWRDIFAREADEVLKQLICQRICDFAQVDPEDYPDSFYPLGSVFATDNILLDRDSVVFHYDPYDVLPYVYGDVEIGFRYEEVEGLMR